MFSCVVVVVDFDQDVTIIHFDTDTINVLHFPIDRDRNAFSCFDPNNGLDIEWIFGITGKECDLELRGCWTTVVDDGCRDFNIGSRRYVVVGYRDGLHTQFRSDCTEAHPLTLKVGVIKGQFRDWACFGIGDNWELVPSCIPAGHVESDKVASLWNNASSCRNIDFTRPIDGLTFLLHTEQR